MRDRVEADATSSVEMAGTTEGRRSIGRVRISAGIVETSDTR